MSTEKEMRREIVFRKYYFPAIESLGKNRRYWFSEIRPLAHVLPALLKEAGMDIMLCNLPPRWEFVICYTEDYNHNLLLKIAYQRHELLERDVDEADLPV